MSDFILGLSEGSLRGPKGRAVWKHATGLVRRDP